ncbi:hypothetical protein CPC08DRAFT_710355 [Agrocybe pediades]|nr:hypothetical protein CPC08DRAFT_710355 [Agrocybe pediades]
MYRFTFRCVSNSARVTRTRCLKQGAEPRCKYEMEHCKISTILLSSTGRIITQVITIWVFALCSSCSSHAFLQNPGTEYTGLKVFNVT